MTLRGRLRIGLVLIGAVLLTGTFGFHYIEGWKWFDGLYMTLITMTTIGYGEVNRLSEAGRVFNTFLIIAAVLSGAFMVGTLTQAMIEFELGGILGRRRMERDLAALKDHYIVCGAGRVGRSTVRELRARGERCVLIEKEQSQAQWALDENLPVLIGTGTNEETLEKARIQTAKGLVAAVTSDADNLYIVLTARGVRADLDIIARASEEEAIPKLRRAGATQVISPYHFVGRRIAHMLLRPNVLELIETAFGSERLDIEIAEIGVREGASIAGQTLHEADIRRRAGVMILALKRSSGHLEFNPAPEAVMNAGDFLIAIGSAEKIKAVEELAGA